MNPAANRNGRTATALTAMLAIALTVLATLGLAQRAHAQPFETGVFDTGAYLGNDTSTPYQRTAAAGGKYVKSFLYWNSIVPGEEPFDWNPRDPSDQNYDFRALDRMVRNAKSAGLEPLITVLGTPGWARANQNCTAGNACAPRIDALGDFMSALGSRYNGGFQGLPAVRYWQLWSEPNLNFFLQPNTAAQYRTMVAEMGSELKAVNPGAKTIGGGLAPLGNDDSVAPLKFMRQLLCMKGRAKPKPSCGTKTTFDIWGHNPYTTGNAFHGAANPDDVSLGDLPLMSKLLTAADKANRIKSTFGKVPFWVTEFSWDTKGPDPRGVPLKRHQRWVAEAFRNMYKANVSVGIWFLLRDQQKEKGNSHRDTYQSGLYFNGGSIAKDKPKPALSAFAFPFTALEQGSGVEIWGRTPKGKSGKVTIQFRERGGAFKTVAKLPTRASGVFMKNLPIRESKGTFRAKFQGKLAPDFELMFDRDYYQPPFGRVSAGRSKIG